MDQRRLPIHGEAKLWTLLFSCVRMDSQIGWETGHKDLQVPPNFNTILWFHLFLMGFLWLTLKFEQRSNCSLTLFCDLWLYTKRLWTTGAFIWAALAKPPASQHTYLRLKHKATPQKEKKKWCQLSVDSWIICLLWVSFGGGVFGFPDKLIFILLLCPAYGGNFNWEAFNCFHGNNNHLGA